MWQCVSWGMRAWILAAVALFSAGNVTFAQSQHAGHRHRTPHVARRTDWRCFVVYVHGHSGDLTPGVASDAERLAYWQGTPDDPDTDFVAASSGHCLTLVTGYDGRASYFSQVPVVASQIENFAREHTVPDSSMILIGHSMGGLIIRMLLNNPNNGGVAGYISQKTSYAITIATPHLGSPGADALQGPTNPCAAPVALGLDLAGSNDPALQSLTTSFLEGVSAPGAAMHDRDRVRMIYTVATTGWNNVTPAPLDLVLMGAWTCMGLATTPGDGLVTAASAAGQYTTNGSVLTFAWTAGSLIEGPIRPWLTVNLNHLHSCKNDQVATIHDAVNNADATMPLGSYIGAHGLVLQ
jgi:pimeloyl-ACP methyl ester carboxylesterase